MAEFTFDEYAEMLLIYGEAHRHGRRARLLYAERFPHRRVPSRTIFARLERRLRERGTFTVNRIDCGAPRRVRTPQFEEDVLRRVERDPSTNTRRMARDLRGSSTTVWRVLHQEHLHPYHIARVPSLGPADFAPRVDFCQWILQRCAEDPAFLQLILFTDEATFSRDGVFNCHNSHMWAVENPHGVRERAFQERFSVNVWAGIINGRLIGPYLLPARLTGANYLIFLQEILPELLQDIPLGIRQHMWFQHDGAPPHFTRAVLHYLNN